MATARGGDLQATLRLAERLETVESQTAENCYNLACVFALARAATLGRSEVSDKERDQLTSRAVSWLRRAQERGMFDDPAMRRHLATDPDLDGIRNQDAFLKLGKEIGK